MSQVCSKCGARKDNEEFRLDPRRNKRRRECRACERRRAKQRRLTKKAQERDRETHTKYMRAYQQTPMAAWKTKVRADTRQLIMNGWIQHPQRCEACGMSVFDTQVQVHHCSYKVCDDILFLCPSCHQLWHQTNPAPPEPDKDWVSAWFDNKVGYPEGVKDDGYDMDKREYPTP